jgi:hypothetical protein
MSICRPIFLCWSGFATPTETFAVFNNFQNVSNGVENPVTLRYQNSLYNTESCLKTDGQQSARTASRT